MKQQPKNQRHQRKQRPVTRKTTSNPKHVAKNPNGLSPITELNLPIVSSFHQFHLYSTFFLLSTIFFWSRTQVIHVIRFGFSSSFHLIFLYYFFRHNCYFFAKESMGTISTDCQFLFFDNDCCGCHNR